MVSAQKYITTYFSSVKKRNILLFKKIKQKSKIDAKIKKERYRKSDLTTLTELIGRTDRLDYGKKLEDQPMRVFLRKMQQSCDILTRHQARLFTQAKKQDIPPELRKTLDGQIKWMLAQLPRINPYINNLAKVYQRQAMALGSGDLKTYLGLIPQEMKAIGDYQLFSEATARRLATGLAKIKDDLAAIMDSMPVEPGPIAFLGAWYMGLIIAFGATCEIAQTATPIAIVGGLLFASTAGIMALVRKILSDHEKELWAT
jgi:hypothetical protein